MSSIQTKILVNGLVQGIGFRPFVYRLAKNLGLKGYVKNTAQGVEILVDGKESDIKKFLEYLKSNHPPMARIDFIDAKIGNFGRVDSFKIVKSSDKKTISTLIPPDIGICEECLKELYDRQDNRFKYFFITCTNCGPRFTITKEIPYDRIRTTMRPFKMCSFCNSEYTDPLTRRYNAQTTSCQKCGPSLSLLDNKGKRISGDPVAQTGRLISSGEIVAIKGVGGVHLACLASDDKVVRKLRNRRKKSDKPFAIMARDIKMIRTFTEVGKEEEKLLESWQRPIVLLGKSSNYWLSDQISPGLHNVGVMLPYSGLHYLLFGYVDGPLIMTSANLPDEPTIIDRNEAFKKMGDAADYFLFHDREIYQRCDDSVLRVVGGKTIFLRRSRGYAPLPTDFKFKTQEKILALGAELSNTFCVYKDGEAFVSQHIGDTYNYDGFLALQKDLKKWMRLFGISSFNVIACDLHPQFNTSRLAEQLSNKFRAKLVKVQHHFAHLASCMAENGLEEAVGIICDGYGFGLDGKAWGGEIIVAKKGKFERVGHLENQPMIGGDAATAYPERIAVGILAKRFDAKKIASGMKLPVGKVKIWTNQIEQGFNSTESSSCGRFLDAVSAFLGVCRYRSYEGEPAMKLESLALRGKMLVELPIEIEKDVLKTTPIFERLFELGKERKEDLALSVHHTLSKGMAQLARKVAKDEGIKTICFSGGVACNELFNKFLRKEIPNLVVQTKVPCGDGGISLGQVYFA